MPEVTRIRPQNDARWLELVSRVPTSVFHSPEWARVLAETYGFEIMANVLLDEDGTPVAGIAYSVVEDVWRARIASLPFSDYCDPIVADPGQWDAIVQPLLRQGLPLNLRCLENSIPLADMRFGRFGHALWHGLDLRPGTSELWEGLKSSARRAIHSGEKSGVSVRVADSIEALEAFYRLHLALRKKKFRLLAQPYAFFEAIWRHFLAPGKGALLLATLGDEVIAAVLLLEWQDTFYYKFSTSSIAHSDLRATDLLIWKTIELGKSRGLNYLDFGLSDPDQAGLVRFKSKFASEERKISFLRSSTGEDAPAALLPGHDLLPAISELLTDPSLPDAITARAGALVYRFFA